MTTDGGNTDDPTARRRRITERGSERLALITGGRASNVPSPPSPTSTTDSPPLTLTLTRHPHQPLASDENKETGGNNARSSKGGETVSRKMESRGSSPKKSTKCELKTYLYKAMGPNQLRPAILASQDKRRKCSLMFGVIALLSHAGFPILGSYIIRSIIISRPLVLLLVMNATIMVGPLLLDAAKMIHQEGDVDLPHHIASPFEWGMLLKATFAAFFMDSCIFSVVVICGISFLHKFGF